VFKEFFAIKFPSLVTAGLLDTLTDKEVGLKLNFLKKKKKKKKKKKSV
jgi:hypothetical protein